MICRKNAREHGACAARGSAACLKAEDEGPDFGVYLCAPISASRFHERIAWASDAERTDIVVIERPPGSVGSAVQRANPNAARWSAQTQGIP
jgi:hypothetical protein